MFNKSDDLIGIVANRQKFGYGNIELLLQDPNKFIARVGDKMVNLDDIKTDPHVSACCQSRKAGAMSLIWEVQPASISDTETQDNPEVLAFVNQVFKKLDIVRIMKSILDAPLYGYAVLEIYWKEIISLDGIKKIVPADVISKPYKWFKFDNNNMLRFCSMLDPFGELLPYRKFLLVQNEASYDNPYGESILSKCLYPVVFKKGGIVYLLKYAQKYGMPHFVGKTDSSPDSEQFSGFLDALDKLMADGSIVINTSDTLESLTTSNPNSSAIYKELIEIFNTEISKAILSQTLTTELQGTGSFAASKTHSGVRDDIIDSDKRLIEQTFNTLIQWIVELNFGEVNALPTFIMYAKEDVDLPLAQVTEYITRGKMLKMLAPFYIRRFGFKEDEFEILETPTATAPPIFNENIDTEEFANNNIDLNEQAQNIIDNQVLKQVSNSGNIFDGMTQPVIDFIQGQGDYNKAIESLKNIFPKMNTQDFQKKLESVLFMADVVGRLTAQEQLKRN